MAATVSTRGRSSSAIQYVVDKPVISHTSRPGVFPNAVLSLKKVKESANNFSNAAHAVDKGISKSYAYNVRVRLKRRPSTMDRLMAINHSDQSANGVESPERGLGR